MARACEDNGIKTNAYTENQKEVFGIYRIHNKRKFGRQVILKARGIVGKYKLTYLMSMSK